MGMHFKNVHVMCFYLNFLDPSWTCMHFRNHRWYLNFLDLRGTSMHVHACLYISLYVLCLKNAHVTCVFILIVLIFVEPQCIPMHSSTFPSMYYVIRMHLWNYYMCFYLDCFHMCQTSMHNACLHIALLLLCYKNVHVFESMHSLKCTYACKITCVSLKAYCIFKRTNTFLKVCAFSFVKK